MGRIGQTTPYPLANNTIRVTLQSAVNLTGDSGSMITLTGLTGSESRDDVLKEVDEVGGSGSGEVWGYTGWWQRLSGSLVLAVRQGQTIMAGKQYVFHFELVNPAHAQDAPEVSVLFSGTPSVFAVAVQHDVTSLLALPGSIPGDAAALKVYAAGFIVKSLAQSSALPGALNTVVISLCATSRILHVGNTTVGIHGLLGSRTDNQTLAVSPTYTTLQSDSVLSAQQPFAAQAQWSQSAGRIVLSLTRDLVPGQLYTASIRLLNPYTNQDSPLNMRISYSSTQYPYYGTMFTSTVAGAFPLHNEVQADVALGDDAVLKVYAPLFLQNFVSQTSSEAGVINNITITLETNFDLSHQHASRLFLTGLPLKSLPASGDFEHLVMCGGFSQNTFYKDVLKSYNGHEWHVVTAAAPWKAREGHQLLNTMLGTQELLLLGGRTVTKDNTHSTGVMEYLNDVWRSSDGGVHWELVTAAADFPPRAWFGAVSYGHMVLVIGGATYKPELRLNDVWQSFDGGNWSLLIAAAPFAGRYGFSCVMHDSLSATTANNFAVTHNVFSTRPQILVVAGSTCKAGCTRFNSSNSNCRTLSGQASAACCLSEEACLQRPNKNDVWKSGDLGQTWLLVGSAPHPWDVRTFAQVSSHVDGSLLLAGGYDSWDRFYRDLWRSFDGGATWEHLQGVYSVYLFSVNLSLSFSFARARGCVLFRSFAFYHLFLHEQPTTKY